MENFWLNDITVLLQSDRLLEIWPNQYYSVARKYNAITRLIIYLTILGYLVTKNVNILLSSIVTLIVFVMLYNFQSKKEGMDTMQKQENNFKKTSFENIMTDKYTFPTKKNPMMNVLLPEIKYNKERKEAAPSYNNAVLRNINKTAQDPELSDKLVNDNKKLYRDLGDNLSFEHTMRNFHTMPNTKIPNDQRKFAEFCYGNMGSCKDGDDIECSKNLRRLGNAFF